MNDSMRPQAIIAVEQHDVAYSELGRFRASNLHNLSIENGGKHALPSRLKAKTKTVGEEFARELAKDTRIGTFARHGT